MEATSPQTGSCCKPAAQGELCNVALQTTPLGAWVKWLFGRNKLASVVLQGFFSCRAERAQCTSCWHHRQDSWGKPLSCSWGSCYYQMQLRRGLSTWKPDGWEKKKSAVPTEHSVQRHKTFPSPFFSVGKLNSLWQNERPHYMEGRHDWKVSVSDCRHWPTVLAAKQMYWNCNFTASKNR